MASSRLGLGVSLFAASITFAATVDRDVVRVANWLVGTFTADLRVGLEGATGHEPTREHVRMTARPLQDPVAFGDGLYVYVETRIDGQASLLLPT